MTSTFAAYKTKFLPAVLFLALGLTSQKAIAAVSITSDFSFLSGAPVSGSFSQDEVTTTVSSTNTEIFSPTGFRDNEGSSVATVDIVFSRVITSFSLEVSHVRNDELINSFNIGDPTFLSGDLVQTVEGVSTSRGDDAGSGSLSWTGLNTNTVSFSIDAPGALGVRSFEATAIPEPSMLPLVFGVVGIALLRRRRC